MSYGDWGDRLNAKQLMLYVGHGSMQHATDLLRRLSDSRFLIENMPKVGLGGEAMIGYSPEQIEELIGDSGMGVCLDFGHAVKAAVSLGVDYKEYVQGFMELEPKVFHVSDGMLSEERDEHLGILGQNSMHSLQERVITAKLGLFIKNDW